MTHLFCQIDAEWHAIWPSCHLKWYKRAVIYSGNLWGCWCDVTALFIPRERRCKALRTLLADLHFSTQVPAPCQSEVQHLLFFPSLPVFFCLVFFCRVSNLQSRTCASFHLLPVRLIGTLLTAFLWSSWLQDRKPVYVRTCIAFSQKVTHAVGNVFIVVFHQLLIALATLQVVKAGADGKTIFEL